MNNKLAIAAIALGAGGAAYIGLTHHAHNTKKPPAEVVSLGETLTQKGRQGLPACAACHGSHGEGNFDQGIPRLAGLNADYIAKQMKDFDRDPVKMGVALEDIPRDYEKTPRIYSDLTVFSPGTRMHPVMNNISHEIHEDEIQAIAAYYSVQSFTAEPVAANYATLERGEDLALRGKPEYGMPACISCHGPDGHGFEEHFPPLVGQPVDYLIKQITDWQNGRRDNDHLGMMRNESFLMTDADKLDVALYYANKSYSINTEGK